MRIKWYKIRIFLIFSILLCGFIAVEVKLYLLQYMQYDVLNEEEKGQIFTDYEIKPKRGNIFDRNGKELAISVDVNSIYATPSKILKKKFTANKLAIATEKQVGLIYKRINKKTKGEVPVVRQIEDETTRKVEDLKKELEEKGYIKKGAIRFVKESKRYYPKEELAGHIVGYTRDDENGDNIGAGGIEYLYDTYLRGSLTSIEVKVDGRRNGIYPISDEELKKSYGNHIYLTIDESIQSIAEKELKRCVEEYEAESGIALVMNCQTGEVLALANSPSFNPNDSSTPLDHRKIRALTDTYEPGSTMKILTTALLLEKGLVESRELFDGEKGVCRFKIGKNKYRRVRDDHPVEIVDFAEAIALSSNIITIKAASRMTPDEFYRGLKDFGVGELSGIDLAGETKGSFASCSQWQGDSMLSIPIGHEVSFSAIQMTSIISGLINDGVLMKPYLVRRVCDVDGNTIKDFEPEIKKRLIGKTASRILRKLLEGVVEFGTGEKAQVEGYRVGGKTGTAAKWDSEEGHYSKSKYLSSFIGFAPVDDPVIIVTVWIDEPKKAKYGGTIAAPVFSRICRDTLFYMGIPKDKNFSEKDYEVLVYNMNSRNANIPGDKDKSKDVQLMPLQDVGNGDTMPSFIGMTMKEARNKLIDIGMDYDFKGMGFVVSQEPKPNSIIDSHTRCLLTFSLD